MRLERPGGGVKPLKRSGEAVRAGRKKLAETGCHTDQKGKSTGMENTYTTETPAFKEPERRKRWILARLLPKPVEW